jgi:hypothetical protein
MITIGFSSHHAETLPFARELMGQHQTMVLEDAPSPHFPDMLEGRLSVDDYMMELDSGFPKFERLMFTMLRELRGSGRQIVQAEPYLETLL